MSYCQGEKIMERVAGGDRDIVCLQIYFLGSVYFMALMRTVLGGREYRGKGIANGFGSHCIFWTVFLLLVSFLVSPIICLSFK